MAENVPQSVEVPIGVQIFGSLVTEMAPTDLPLGVSPDNQDVIYVPGSVASRPGLHALFEALPDHPTITHFKTYIQADGSPLTIIIDSLGRIWKEDVFADPLTLTQIGKTAPGSFCNSVTAFNREYFASHNGIHGTDVPRQFDGTYFDRVTQDGPAKPPTIGSIISQPAAISGAGVGAPIAVVSITPVDFITI